MNKDASDMWNALLEKLESLPAALAGGALLLVSFFADKLPFALPLDPAWITVFVCGLPIVAEALETLLSEEGVAKISSALLITIAMCAAIAIGDLFAAGEVAFIMALGEMLEEHTTNRAKEGLKKLLSLAPVQGRRIDGDREELVSAESIVVDDLLRVLPGESIPVDGVIVAGETSVDQSVMTGESLPVEKGMGDSVFAGTINRFGAIDMRATKVGEDSSLAKLIRMVEEAEQRQAPTQRIVDKWASWLVPAALALSLIAYLTTGNVVTAVTILVVFCPCALVLATPTAIMAAIGQATKYGVIIKSGEALEAMGSVDTLAFDKTGTLTSGVLSVGAKRVLREGLTDERLLELAASLELKSEHPLGRAVVNAARDAGLALRSPERFFMNAGKGVRGEVDGTELWCANAAWLEEEGIHLSSEAHKAALELRREGFAAVFLADRHGALGVLGLSDKLRSEAPAMVANLTRMGVASTLLTGDHKETAEHFAKLAGITDVRAELLPADKVAAIESLTNAGRHVAMIGDGVNDAPALKTASVGVAMGTMGSDIAIEAADIALMGDDLSKIPYLKRLSNETVKTIMLSISLSMIINGIAIVLSFMGILTPTTGALVHNLGSFVVVLIAAKLYDRKFPEAHERSSAPSVQAA